MSLIPAFFKKSLFNTQTDTSKALIPAFLKNVSISRDINYGGIGSISGVVKAGAQPLKRQVRLYDAKSGLLITALWSDENGAYVFENINENTKYTLTTTDNQAIYNDVIAANITPTT